MAARSGRRGPARPCRSVGRCQHESPAALPGQGAAAIALASWLPRCGVAGGGPGGQGAPPSAVGWGAGGGRAPAPKLMPTLRCRVLASGRTPWGRFVGFLSQIPAVFLAPRELRAEGLSIGTARRGPQGSPHPESSPNLGLCRGLVKQQWLLIASDDSERQLAAGTSLHAVTPGHGQRHRGWWWPWGNRAWGGSGVGVPCSF